MAELPTLEDALRDVPTVKLDQECTSDDLKVISRSLTRWVEVSPWLGLTEADEEDIRAKSDLECNQRGTTSKKLFSCLI